MGKQNLGRGTVSVGNKSSSGSVREESVNDENLSLSRIFLCGPGGLVTYILHIYILNAYIQCNYALAHKHLEELLLYFKGFQSTNLGNITDISGRLGTTLIFKIITNVFMKYRLFFQVDWIKSHEKDVEMEAKSTHSRMFRVSIPIIF